CPAGGDTALAEIGSRPVTIQGLGDSIEQHRCSIQPEAPWKTLEPCRTGRAAGRRYERLPSAEEEQPRQGGRDRQRQQPPCAQTREDSDQERCEGSARAE